MKFGILTLQKDAAGQNITLMNLVNPASIIDPAKYIKHALKSGIKHFEITYDINTIAPGVFNKDKVDELKDLKENHELSYSVHLPLWAVELSCPHPHIRNAGIKLSVEAINTMESLQPENYVLHATGALAAEFLRMGLPKPVDAFLARYMLKYAYESIEQIINDTGISSRKIAVENIEFPFELMSDMIKKLDLSVCLDVGHVLAGYCGSQSIENFIDKYIDRIIEIHLHDGYKRSNGVQSEVSDHIALGNGSLDYRKLILKLMNLGYDKRIIFELGLSETLESLKVLSEYFTIDLKKDILTVK